MMSVLLFIEKYLALVKNPALHEQVIPGILKKVCGTGLRSPVE
jgi:hypothetical protein